MPKRSRCSRARGLFPVLFATLCCGPVEAYIEDLCPARGGGWTECVSNPCAPENEFLGCGAVAMLTTFQTQATGGPGERSTLHFDATYLMAQAAGFSARDAYVTAAYDAATDSGRYVHRGQQGALAVDPAHCDAEPAPAACALLTKTILGVMRNNFVEGGLFFHFMTADAADWQAPVLGDAAQEPFLHHLRRWAYGEGPLCVGGLVAASGVGCFESPSRTPSTLVGRIPLVGELGFLTSVDWVAEITEQKVGTDTAANANLPASALPTQLPVQDLPLAKLGIFLHALGDRVSHHRCVDESAIAGPRPADARILVLNPLPDFLYQTFLHLGSLQSYLQTLYVTPVVHNPDYLFEFSRYECGQPDHFLRHTWETGHDQHQLAPENRTALHGLLAVLDELLRFAQKHGMPAAPTLSTQERLALVEDILAATGVADPQARVDALTALAQQRGWLPLPLHAGLTHEAWMQKASAAHFAEDEQDGHAGGGAMSPPLLVLLWAMTCRRRSTFGRLPGVAA